MVIFLQRLNGIVWDRVAGGAGCCPKNGQYAKRLKIVISYDIIILSDKITVRQYALLNDGGLY